MDGLSDTQRAALRLTVAATAACTLIWFVNWSQRRPLLFGATSDDEERARLRPVLEELSRRFFVVCMEVAAVAKTVRVRVQENKVDISDEKLREQLARQCQVFEKLKEIQAEVVQEYGIRSEDLDELQLKHAQDEQVRSFSEGLSDMLKNALGGIAPVLPNVEIPDTLTEDKVLEILAEVHGLETQKVLGEVGGTRLSVKDLGEVLTVAHNKAWQETLEAHSSEIDGGSEVYYSALAIFMSKDEFADKRKKLDEMHQQRMVKLFTPEHKAPAAADATSSAAASAGQ